MAVSVNWTTKVIFVPKADMPITQVSPEIREFDLEQFRLDLKTLEATPEGMPHQDTQVHNTTYVISGFTYARAFSIINGYTVEFEDDQYGVAPFGANANILDVKVANQVSYQSQNSGGLLVTETSGLTAGESATLTLLTQLMQNARIQDENHPDGSSWVVLTDDGLGELVKGRAWADVDGLIPWDGTGPVLRVDRLE